MQERNQKIIDAVIQKAEKLCSDQLLLIGIYGSFATGDIHPKSDLDLLLLVQDEAGRQLGSAFVLEDADIGYDIYCTTWAMLEEDAQCHHAQLAKLMDSQLIYVKDPAALPRLEALRTQAASLLASPRRAEKALAQLDRAMTMYAECCLAGSLSLCRRYAGAAVHCLLEALMLFHGRYFRLGMKRTFEELAQLPLPFNIQALVMSLLRAEDAEAVCRELTKLINTVRAHMTLPAEKVPPAPENLIGTYEEMVSNWRGKMQEAAENGDLFSSFMNLLSFQFMLQEISESVDIPPEDAMAGFDPQDLTGNAARFDAALSRYLENYHRAGIRAKRYACSNDWVAEYLQAD